MSGLFIKQKKGQLPEVDISKLTADDKKRLEAIVLGCNNEREVERFYEIIGDEDKLFEIGKEQNEYNPFWKLENAEKLGISEDEKRQMLRQLYTSKYENSPDRHLFGIELMFLKFADLLDEDVKIQLQQNLLYKVMTAREMIDDSNEDVAVSGYLDEIDEIAQKIPAEKAKETALKAYNDMREKYEPGLSELYAVRSALIAQKFGLGKDKVIEAIKPEIDFWTKKG